MATESGPVSRSIVAAALIATAIALSPPPVQAQDAPSPERVPPRLLEHVGAAPPEGLEDRDASVVLEIVVADTGVGISPEDLERLGRPYEQAGGAEQRSRGTGLGLSLVRAFAKLHGGEMMIESRLGVGTTVSVRLPVLLAPMVSAATPRSNASLDFSD